MGAVNKAFYGKIQREKTFDNSLRKLYIVLTFLSRKNKDG